MNEQRWKLLFLFVGLFTVVTLLVTWNSIYQYETHFTSGTNPDINPKAPPKPQLPTIRPEDPTRGSKQAAAITVVEFGDYYSLDARVDELALNEVLANNAGAVKLIWRDFPTATDRDDGWLAASAARCAGAQGAFWNMHDALMQAKSIDQAALAKLVAQEHLVPDTFNACLLSPQTLENLYHDLQDAKTNNIVTAPRRL